MDNRGQSMIEYVLIAVLVILGVVVMGPYVLRSVNAHFKLWDEGVRDSFTEKITQAPVGDVPDIPVNCVCRTQRGGCGSSSGPVGNCNPNEREYDYICNPQGCNGADEDFYCVADPSCCMYAGRGCGTYPCPLDGCPTTPTSPPQGTNCYYGYEIQAQTCAFDNSIQCIYCPPGRGCFDPNGNPLNPSGCAPACLGPSPPDPNSSACPGSPGTTPDFPLRTTGAVNHLSPECTFNGGGGYDPPTATACEYTFDTANGYRYEDGKCVKGSTMCGIDCGTCQDQIFYQPKVCNGSYSVYAGHGPSGIDRIAADAALIFCHSKGYTGIICDSDSFRGPYCRNGCTCPASSDTCGQNCGGNGCAGCSNCHVWSQIKCTNKIIGTQC